MVIGHLGITFKHSTKIKSIRTCVISRALFYTSRNITDGPNFYYMSLFYYMSFRPFTSSLRIHSVLSLTQLLCYNRSNNLPSHYFRYAGVFPLSRDSKTPSLGIKDRKQLTSYSTSDAYSCLL